MNDYTLVQENESYIRVHRPDCPLVDKARRNGKPLITMFGCEREPSGLSLPDGLLRCTCLEAKS